jgi:hypothetical protein
VATTSKKPAETSTPAVFTCPECGKTFARAAALGAHRKITHGVAGTSSNAAANRRRKATAASSSRRRRVAATASNGRAQTVDRDALLRTLFPDGIPPRQDVIGAVNDWLDEAERLAGRR